MTGCRHLFLSGDKILKMTQPKNHKYKPELQFANQNVLEVILFYEIKNRKPNVLIMVDFDRFRLDCNGVYEQTDEDRRRALHNFFEFGFPSLFDEEDDDRPVSIPVAPIIPTESEKKLLYSYIAEKLPKLSIDAPYIVENRIRVLKEKYEEFVRMAKNAKRRA